jgi:hypothetical protein
MITDKTFVVTLVYQQTIEVEVFANSEQEAIDYVIGEANDGEGDASFERGPRSLVYSSGYETTGRTQPE